VKNVSKKVNKFSLRNLHVKLIFSFTLILIIPALAIGLLSYETAKSEMEKSILNSVNENVAMLVTPIATSL